MRISDWSSDVCSSDLTWTLDGEQLNDVTFFGGIEAGKPMVKERDRKRDPLPKFTSSTLLIEIPELLEGTYRTHKQIGAFRLLTTAPAKFLGQDGVSFPYDYVDSDLTVRGGGIGRATGRVR